MINIVCHLCYLCNLYFSLTFYILKDEKESKCFFFQLKVLYNICIYSRMLTSLTHFWEVYIENLKNVENVAFWHTNHKASHKAKCHFRCTSLSSYVGKYLLNIVYPK